MNTLILSATDRLNDSQIFCVTGDRHKHILTHLRKSSGDSLRCGVLDGSLGICQITRQDADTTYLNFTPLNPPPPTLDCTLVLALPRPKMLSRILQSAMTLGCKEIHLINSYRVEKSYWQTDRISAPRIDDDIREALAQSNDTIAPKVYLHKRFRPFVEDQLPKLLIDRQGFVAHPYTERSLDIEAQNPSLLVVGPEGGFINFEIDLLRAQGVSRCVLGRGYSGLKQQFPRYLGALCCSAFIEY